MTADVKKKLTERICREYCIDQCNAQAKTSELCLKCPDLLKKNLYQWACEEQLEDIYVGKYSVPMVMAIWGNSDFLSAVEVVTEYLTGDQDIAERRIWQMRR